MRNIAIIFNPKSGSANRLEEIVKYYSLLSPELYRVDITVLKESDKPFTVARTYAMEEWDVIAAAGGDGTISAVAAALATTTRTLGVLPIGTLNHFAKDLGIPLDITLALDVITSGERVIKIDVATCNDQTFINNSSIGVYPKLIELREHYQARGELKWLAFLFATRLLIARIPKIRVMLETEGRKIGRYTSFIFVGNNHYALEGWSAGSRTGLSSGTLSLWITRTTTLLGFMRMATLMLIGRIRQDKDLDVFHPKDVEIVIEAKELNVSFDGEVVLMKSPLCYKIVPKCLAVIVPTLP